jgi:hypothetical protein
MSQALDHVRGVREHPTGQRSGCGAPSAVGGGLARGNVVSRRLCHCNISILLSYVLESAR